MSANYWLLHEFEDGSTLEVATGPTEEKLKPVYSAITFPESWLLQVVMNLKAGFHSRTGDEAKTLVLGFEVAQAGWRNISPGSLEGAKVLGLNVTINITQLWSVEVR